MESQDNICELKILARNLLKKTDSYIYDDVRFMKRLKKTLEMESEDPYYYVSKNMIEKIKKNKGNDRNKEDECCVCLEMRNYDEYVYYDCKHKICKKCYEMLHGNNICQLCRSKIKALPYSEKYAILCGGDDEFNGDYKSIVMFYDPEFDEKKSEMFNDSVSLMIKINTILNNDYIVLVQEPESIKEWMLRENMEYIFDDRRIIWDT